MVLFLTVIIGTVEILSLVDAIFATKAFNIPAWNFIIMILVSLVVVVLIDGIIALIVNKLPNKWFKVDKKCFSVSKREQHFYEKIGIRKWKDKIWELGSLGGFSKKKFESPNNPEYIEKFLIESNKGVFEHFFGMFFGFLIILMFPKYVWVVGFPIAFVNWVLNLLPIMVLRYNTPKLKVALKRLQRNSERNVEENMLKFNDNEKC